MPKVRYTKVAHTSRRFNRLALAGRLARNLGRNQIGAIPTAAGGITRLAYARAKDAGIEVASLLKQARLTDNDIRDRQSRISVKDQITFLNLTALALKDNLLGFHLAQTLDLRELGLLYYVPASSRTIGEALFRLTRYSSMANESLQVEYSDRRNIHVAVRYLGVARHSDRHQIEFCVTALIRLCRKLTGHRFGPTRIMLTHRRVDCSELNAFFGCDVEQGARGDEVRFASSIRDMPIVSADPYLNELLVANCEEAHSRRRMRQRSFRTEVENAIVPSLPHGNFGMSETARHLGLSPRTLARRLMAEGLTFTKVLESMRNDLALQYLSDSGLSVSQTAWLLGYQETSAFTHAFKRWTGKTPRESRSARHDSKGGM